jgi:hypothetical protein
LNLPGADESAQNVANVLEEAAGSCYGSTLFFFPLPHKTQMALLMRSE